MRRLFKFLGLLVLVCIVLVTLHVKIAGRDIPPQPYPDLMVEYVPIPDEENAFTFFLRAFEGSTLEEHEELIKDYLDTDDQTIEFYALMQENKEIVALLGEGVDKGICQCPEIHGFKDEVSFVSDWLLMSKFLVGSSKWYRTQGEPGKAVESMELLFHFGSLVQEHPESLLQYLVGIAQLEMVADEALKIAKDPKITPKQLRELVEGSLSNISLKRGLMTSFKQEYKLADSMISDIENGKISTRGLTPMNEENHSFLEKDLFSGYLFQPNKTRAVFAEHYRNIIAMVSQPLSEIKFDDDEFTAFDGGKIRRLMRPNAIGDLLISLLLPALDGAILKMTVVESKIEGVEVLLALQLYQQDQGTYPDRLEDLVPEYLDAVPVDLFDGEFLRYDQGRKLFYSVGRNQKDYGGLSRGNADLVFTLE